MKRADSTAKAAIAISVGAADRVSGAQQHARQAQKKRAITSAI